MKRNMVEYFRGKNVWSSTSLILTYAGREQNRSNHNFGPAVRAHYLIHFITKGSGSFYVNNKEYTLSKNQMFIIKPGESTFYIADKDDPWEYIWIAFNGTAVETILRDCGLLSENPTAYFEPSLYLINLLTDIIDQLSSKTENEYTLLGNLYCIFGILSRNYYEKSSHSVHLYIKQATNFIQNNYRYDIRVQDIADYVQIDRTYLYRLFMDEYGYSPKQYLQNYRIKTAAELLTNSNLTVLEIANSCGFKDSSAFSKYFRKQLGFTPTKYRSIDGTSTLSYVNDKIN